MEIKIVDKREEKLDIIKHCDSNFPIGLLKHTNWQKIFDKIDKYAIFIGAYSSNQKGNSVGYAAFYANDEITLTAYITMFGVCKEMQRKHVGSLLMEKCISLSREKGMRLIRLEVLKTNTNAIAFYQHWGFQKEKDATASTIYMVKE